MLKTNEETTAHRERGDRSAIPAPAGQQPLGPAAAALTLFICALWGGTPVAVHFAVDQLPPVLVAAIRFAMAAVFMLVWCRFEGSPLRLEEGQFRPALITSVLLFFQITTFTVGISHTSASHATVLINTFVFFVAAIEHFITRRIRLQGASVLGLVLAAAGGLIVLLVSESDAQASAGNDPSSLFGDVLLVASALVLAIKIIYTKHAVRVMEPGKLMFWHDVIGVAMFAVWSGLFENADLRHLTAIRLPTLLGLLYQGMVISGFCFAVQALLLKRHAASTISIFSVTTPLFGIMAAFLFRGDPLSPWLILSGLCVAAGIYLVNRPR